MHTYFSNSGNGGKQKMIENAFFRYVNRFNSVALMIVLLGALFGLAYLAMRSSNWEDRRAVKVENSSDKEGSIKLLLGNIEEVDGSEASYVVLREKDGGSSFGSGSEYGANRNVLFFPNREMKPVWLFENNQQLIERISVLKVGGYNSKHPVAAFLYEVINQDTNNNSKLDSDDKLMVGFSRPDGSGYVGKSEPIDSLIDHFVSADGSEVALMYQVDGKVYVDRISLEDFSSKSKIEITQLKKI